jgi:hypothetical protein
MKYKCRIDFLLTIYMGVISCYGEYGKSNNLMILSKYVRIYILFNYIGLYCIHANSGVQSPLFVCPINTRYDILEFPPKCLFCESVQSRSATIFERNISVEWIKMPTRVAQENATALSTLAQNNSCGCWESKVRILLRLDSKYITNGLIWHNNKAFRFIKTADIFVGDDVNGTDFRLWYRYSFNSNVSLYSFYTLRGINIKQTVLFDLPVRAKYALLDISQYVNHEYTDNSIPFSVSSITSHMEPFLCASCSMLANGTCCPPYMFAFNSTQCIKCMEPRHVATNLVPLVNDNPQCSSCRPGFYPVETYKNGSSVSECFLSYSITKQILIWDREWKIYIHVMPDVGVTFVHDLDLLEHLTLYRYSVFFARHHWNTSHPCEGIRDECCLLEHEGKFMSDKVMGGIKCPAQRTSDQIRFNHSSNPFYENQTAYRLYRSDILTYFSCSPHTMNETFSVDGVSYVRCVGTLGVLVLRGFEFSDVFEYMVKVFPVEVVVRTVSLTAVISPVRIKIPRDLNLRPDTNVVILKNRSSSNVYIRNFLMQHHIPETYIHRVVLRTDICTDSIGDYDIDLSHDFWEGLTPFFNIASYAVSKTQWYGVDMKNRTCENLKWSAMQLRVYLTSRIFKNIHVPAKQVSVFEVGSSDHESVTIGNQYLYTPNIYIYMGLQLQELRLDTHVDDELLFNGFGDTDRIITFLMPCARKNACDIPNSQTTFDALGVRSPSSNLTNEVRVVSNISIFNLHNCVEVDFLENMSRSIAETTVLHKFGDHILMSRLQLFIHKLCNNIIQDRDINLSSTHVFELDMHKSKKRAVIFILPELDVNVRRRIVQFLVTFQTKYF